MFTLSRGLLDPTSQHCWTGKKSLFFLIFSQNRQKMVFWCLCVAAVCFFILVELAQTQFIHFFCRCKSILSTFSQQMLRPLRHWRACFTEALNSFYQISWSPYKFYKTKKIRRKAYAIAQYHVFPSLIFKTIISKMSEYKFPFYCRSNKTCFFAKVFALDLVSKVRDFGTFYYLRRGKCKCHNFYFSFCFDE